MQSFISKLVVEHGFQSLMVCNCLENLSFTYFSTAIKVNELKCILFCCSFIQINVNGLQQSVLKYVACFISCWSDVFTWYMLWLVDMCKCVKEVQISSIPSSWNCYFMFSSTLTFIITANWNIKTVKEIYDAYILCAVGFVIWAVVEKNPL